MLPDREGIGDGPALPVLDLVLVGLGDSAELGEEVPVAEALPATISDAEDDCELVPVSDELGDTDPL